MSKPKNCIPVADAKVLQANWNNNQAKDIKSSTGSIDSCSVTFSIDEIQEFIDYVKVESKKQGFNNPGIRVYFAANNTVEPNKATVFLNATESDDSTSANNYGIDALDRHQGDWPPHAY